MILEADQAVQEASFAGACQDQHAGVLRLAWGGLAKGNQSCMKGSKVTGSGARGPGPRAWGRGLQGLGAGASRALGPRPPEAWGEGLGDG